MGFSALLGKEFVHCVLACTGPVAVHVWSSTCARDEISGVGHGMTEVGVGHVSWGLKESPRGYWPSDDVYAPFLCLASYERVVTLMTDILARRPRELFLRT